jgi:hypothetical protein
MKGKEINLNLLLEGLFGLNNIEVEDFGRGLYTAQFLTNYVSGIHPTHDGQKVSFSLNRFDHAFFESPAKDLIDRSRVARIRWILPLIQGLAINSQCWLVNDDGVEKRLYICYGLNYVVWLELHYKQEGSWVFSTAYVAERDEIKKYTSKGKLIQKFNSKEKEKKKKRKRKGS